jgi:type VI secretion system protein ImpE
VTLAPSAVLAPEARSLLRSAGCEAALEQLKKDVRKAPREPRLRTFLFQMFCIAGAWDRALTQLAVAAELDPAAVPMAQTYRALIRCEMLRERVFAGTRTPTFMGAPEPWMPLLVEALRVLAGGAEAEAAGLRDAAFEQAPETAGTLNGEDFAWIADADPRLGPVLEAMVEGKYYWVPFGRIAQINADPPEDLRDQVWMPARITWSSGGETVGFIPTRYPGSAQAGSDLALARRTEWADRGDWQIGLGQRMLTTDGPEVAIMDLRRLSIAQPG